MRRRVLFALTVAACLAVSIASAREATAELAAGPPLTFADGQSIELLEVSDSRCPRAARCARAGHVVLLLHWRSSPSAAPMRLTLATTDADGQTRKACLNGMQLRIRSVAPLARSEPPLTLQDYRVTFAVGTCPNERATS